MKIFWFSQISLPLSLPLCACFSILHFFGIFSVGDNVTWWYMQVTCRGFDLSAKRNYVLFVSSLRIQYTCH